MRLSRFLAGAFYFCAISVPGAHASNANNVEVTVTGTGSTIDLARSDAIRQALQLTIRQLVVVDREISRNAVLRDRVLSTMNGYVERFVVQSETRADAGFSVKAKITVSASRIENFIGIVASEGGAINGEGLLAEQARRHAQAQADLLKRKARGEIFDNILRSFPSKAMAVRTLGIGLSDTNPDELRIAVEISPQPSFVSALEGTIKALSAIECLPVQRNPGDNQNMYYAASAFRAKANCHSGNTLYGGAPITTQTVVCLGFETRIQCYGLEPGDYCASCYLDGFSSIENTNSVNAKQLAVFGRFVDQTGTRTASVSCLKKLAEPRNLFGVYLERDRWRKGKPLTVAVFDFARKRAEIAMRASDVNLNAAKYFVGVAALAGPTGLFSGTQRIMTNVLDSRDAERTACALVDEAVHIRQMEGFVE